MLAHTFFAAAVSRMVLLSYPLSCSLWHGFQHGLGLLAVMHLIACQAQGNGTTISVSEGICS